MAAPRAKLLNPANFGPQGIYPKSIVITDAYATYGSLTQVTQLPYDQVFFFGAFNLNDPLIGQFSAAEIDSLYRWSKQGGKLIIAASSAVTAYNPAVLNSKWGFDITQLDPSYILPTIAGNNTGIFNGPFGTVGSGVEGGSAEGYFNTMPPNAIALAIDVNNAPTLIIDCNTLDLIVADVDVYTTVGAISPANTIINDEDRLWANTIAFMDQLEGPPVITNTNFNLSTATYAAYQWYLNGAPITGANAQTFGVTQNGTYSVEATLKCGCKLMADTVVIDNYVAGYVVPNAFTPNADGKNDELYVIASAIDNMAFSIYDRWGEKVFETHNLATGWDGTFKGKPLSAQTFMYYLQGTLTNGQPVNSKGCITLLR